MALGIVGTMVLALGIGTRCFADPPREEPIQSSSTVGLNAAAVEGFPYLPNPDLPIFQQISQTTPATPAPPAVPPMVSPPVQEEYADMGSGIGLGGPMVGGYLDLAAPVTQFRLRYDDAQNNKFPDRGEYVYAQCGCFRDLGIDKTAKGPPGVNTAASYQAVRAYSEYAFSTKMSVFAEIPAEWMHFDTVGNGSTTVGGLTTTSPINSAGPGDLNAGFKYAFIAKPREYLTFQFRTYIPTGDSYLGLGTAHVSLEPSLLYYNQLTDHWLIQGQLTEITPIAVTGFASDVLQYGAGLGYILLRNRKVVVTPTLETVGWTFLGGQKFSPSGGLQSANGDTIVNIKPGVRVGFGDVNAPAGQQRHSLYFGWGHALTNQQLYQDIYRVEYRILF